MSSAPSTSRLKFAIGGPPPLPVLSARRSLLGQSIIDITEEAEPAAPCTRDSVDASVDEVAGRYVGGLARLEARQEALRQRRDKARKRKDPTRYLNEVRSSSKNTSRAGSKDCTSATSSRIPTKQTSGDLSEITSRKPTKQDADVGSRRCSKRRSAEDRMLTTYSEQGHGYPEEGTGRTSGVVLPLIGDALHEGSCTNDSTCSDEESTAAAGDSSELDRPTVSTIDLDLIQSPRRRNSAGTQVEEGDRRKSVELKESGRRASELIFINTTPRAPAVPRRSSAKTTPRARGSLPGARPYWPPPSSSRDAAANGVTPRGRGSERLSFGGIDGSPSARKCCAEAGGSPTIGFSECVSLAKKHKFPLDEVKRIADDFRVMDVNGDGSLSQEEFFGKLRKRHDLSDDGEPLPPHLLLQSFSGADQDASGALSFEEYLVWSMTHGYVEEMLVPDAYDRLVRKVARDLKVTLPYVEEIHAKFLKYDQDRSGYIDQREFRQVVLDLFKAKTDDGLSDKRLRQYWAEADTDGSSTISFEEFATWFCRATLE